MKRKRPVAPALLLCIALVLAAVTPSGAHKVNLFAYVEGNTVHVEGYFVDGSPSRHSRILAYAADGAIVSEGTTDVHGLYQFAVDTPQTLRLVLEASMGHRSEITLPATEFGTVTPTNTVQPTSPPATPAPAVAAVQSVDAAVIDQLLAQRLRPLEEGLRKLQQARERPGMTEIIGGLGYIVGLAGIYLWAISRKKS